MLNTADYEREMRSYASPNVKMSYARASRFGDAVGARRGHLQEGGFFVDLIVEDGRVPSRGEIAGKRRGGFCR